MEYLTFSDSAKFAQAALNVIRGQGMHASHSFFNTQLLSSFSSESQFFVGFLPLPSWILSLVFRFFPATDQTIAITGLVFLSLSAILIYFIGKKLHSKIVGLVSALFFLLSPFFQEYALNFSSEITFVFLILLAVHLLLSPKKYKAFSLIPLFLMFFVRQQASIFVGSFLFIPLLIFIFKKSSKKKSRLVFAIISILTLGLLINLSAGSISSTFNIAAGSNFGSYIRGGGYQDLGRMELFSKVFYNIYNFLKVPSRLAFPSIFFLFIYSLFLKSKQKKLNYFKLSATVALFSFVLAASATLPNARYVHPIIPLVMIVAGIGLVELVKNFPKKLQTFGLVVFMFFITLPTIGHFTLDARARAKQFNIGKPPVYKQISSIMAEDIPQGEIIITNLDAWAAWYEGLTTMWFPLEIKMLEGHQDQVEYIVITNYKEHDGDFALGEWKEVVYQPKNIQNEFLNQNYQVLKTFKITPESVYENKQFIGTILKRI